jgi:hypothetical protein
VLHRPVVGLGEQEADAGLVQGAKLLAALASMLTPSGGQHVGGAGLAR